MKYGVAADWCGWTIRLLPMAAEPLQGFEPHFLEDIFAGEASNPLAGSGRLFDSENMTEIYAASGNR